MKIKVAISTTMWWDCIFAPVQGMNIYLHQIEFPLWNQMLGS